MLRIGTRPWRRHGAVVTCAALLAGALGASIPTSHTASAMCVNYPCTGGTSVAMTAMPTARMMLAAATGQDGRIYTFGGLDASGTSAPGQVVEAYDPNTNRWTCSVGDPAPSRCSSKTIAPMPASQYLMGAATGPDGRIYVIGGSTVEAYDPSTNTWACSVGDSRPGCSSSSLAPLPTPRIRLAVTKGPDGQIYAIGGYVSSQNQETGAVESYDVNANRWTTRPSLATPRDNVTAASGPDGRVYAIGGSAGGYLTPTPEAYVPGEAGWGAAASLPTPVYSAAAATGSDGNIYEIGGNKGYGNVTATVQRYNTSTGSWIPVASMKTAREYEGATLGPDGRIYAIGGSTTDGYGTVLNTVEAYAPGTGSWSSSTTIGSL